MVLEKHIQDLGMLYKEINDLKEQIHKLNYENDLLKSNLQSREAGLETLTQQLECIQHNQDLEL